MIAIKLKWPWPSWTIGDWSFWILMTLLFGAVVIGIHRDVLDDLDQKEKAATKINPLIEENCTLTGVSVLNNSSFRKVYTCDEDTLQLIFNEINNDT